MPLPTSTRAKVATLAVAVGGVTAATTHVVENNLLAHASKFFPTCGATDSTFQRRMVKYREALAAGRDVYVVPVVPDSSGYPALDLADRNKVDSLTLLSVLCTLPADSTILPGRLIIGVDSAATDSLNRVDSARK